MFGPFFFLLLIKFARYSKLLEIFMLCTEMASMPRDYPRNGFPVSKRRNSNLQTLCVLFDLFSLMRTNCRRWLKKPHQYSRELAQKMANSRVNAVCYLHSMGKVQNKQNLKEAIHLKRPDSRYSVIIQQNNTIISVKAKRDYNENWLTRWQALVWAPFDIFTQWVKSRTTKS